MSARFVANAAFQRELMRENQFRLGLRAEAEEIKAIAERSVHRIMPRQHDPIEVVMDAEGIAVANTDHGGHLEEWGSKNNPPYATLRRAVREAGLRLRESPKA